MVTVKLLDSVRVDGNVHVADEQLDLPDATAERFIRIGYAVKVEKPKRTKKEPDA